MPELPEVEVTRRSFAPAISGAVIQDARVGKPLRWPLGCAIAQLVGQTVKAVRRRGKYLLLDLDTGVLLIHLGMSGSLRFATHATPMGVHDHFELLTDRGGLRLHDPRRFGAVVFSLAEDSGMAARLLGKLGVEPLTDDFDPLQFAANLRKRRTTIKQVLLGGDLVVGVGNIYACEALYQAGIRPTARADRIGRVRALRLHQAIRAVLAQAVQRGGSTLRNFSSASGESGHFQHEAAVYGRTGQPCRQCATPITLLRQGQRSSFFCHKCQRN